MTSIAQDLATWASEQGPGQDQNLGSSGHVDLITVAHELVDKGQLEARDGLAYVDSMTACRNSSIDNSICGSQGPLAA